MALVGIAVVGLAAVLIGPGAWTAGAQGEASVPGAWTAGPTGEPDDLRVYVIVLDGLQSGEVDNTLTPNLAELRRNGTWYDQARAVFPAETLPNHAAMMTGIAPGRNGIIGNDFWFPGAPSNAQKIRMQWPELLGADTLTTTLENRCTVSTATVQSKGYLWGLFRGEPHDPDDEPPNPVPGLNHSNPDHPGNQRQADFHPKPANQPGYINDPDDHVIDQSVMNIALLPWVRSEPAKPQFAFVNLGDIDRAGHIDQGGAFTAGGLTAFRRTAISDTDALVGQFVQELEGAGAWEETVLLFASDHGMDWGPQNQDVENPMLNALGAEGYFLEDPPAPGDKPGSKGEFKFVSGGGTSAIYVEDPADIPAMAAILADPAKVPGVDLVATRSPVTSDDPDIESRLTTLEEMGMDHRDNGDIVVLTKPGWAFRFGISGNPIPGNHGQPATQHSVLMVSGGHPMVRKDGERFGGENVYQPPRVPFSDPREGPGNLSIAPTVAAIFGLPTGTYDRPPLTDSFKPWALQPHPPCRAATEPTQAGAPVGGEPSELPQEPEAGEPGGGPESGGQEQQAAPQGGQSQADDRLKRCKAQVRKLRRKVKRLDRKADRRERKGKDKKAKRAKRKKRKAKTRLEKQRERCTAIGAR